MDIKNLKTGDKVLVECTVQAVFADSKMVMVTTRDCTEGFDAYIDEIQEPLEQEPTTKQLEKMYEDYEKSLWREHEDVRGDDMVEMGTALNLLQEELCLLGCWDDDFEPQADRSEE